MAQLYPAPRPNVVTMLVSIFSTIVRKNVVVFSPVEMGKSDVIRLPIEQLPHPNDGLKLLRVSRPRQSKHRATTGLPRRHPVLTPVTILGGKACLLAKGSFGVRCTTKNETATRTNSAGTVLR